jgi:hypothetical protein
MKQISVSNVAFISFNAIFQNTIFKTSAIKYFLFTLLLFFSYNSVYSQKKYALHLGTGLGHSLNKNKLNRAKIQLNGYYNINSQLSVGFEATSSGSLNHSKNISLNEVNVDPATNAIRLEPTNIGSAHFLAKVKYYLQDKEKGFKPFIEFGAGINTYQRKIFDVPMLTSQKIKRNNFAFQPEAGFSVGHFQMSMGYLIGGKTPAFAGVNEQGQNVKMGSISLNTLYFNASWRFDFGKKVNE